MSVGFTDGFFGRSVFLTGHTGFKGSWLALWLHRLGAHVTGYSLPSPADPSNFVSSRVGETLVRSYDADVRDFAALQAALRACQPDLVIHLAAQALVRQSYLDARETFDVNIMGTANVLESVRSLHRPCTVIVVTSDKCYDNSDHQRVHRETDPLGGNDPYSASKAAAEIVTSAYRKSFFSPEGLAAPSIKVATVRAGNVVGGGDWAVDRIVPDAVRALSSGRPLAVRNPGSIRPWQHVLEPLSGYLTLASRMLSSDDPALCSSWNFGPTAEDEATVEDLVEGFCQAWGNGKWQRSGVRDQLAEERCLRLSSTKAREQLGWQPRWSFHEAVERTARWYRTFHDGPACSTRDLCVRDISDYETSDSGTDSSLNFMRLADSTGTTDRISG